MIGIVLLCLVIGFVASAPGINGRYGTAALWLVAAAVSLLAGLAVVLLDEPNPKAPIGWLFFWPTVIATATGFLLVILLVRRGRGRLQPGPAWVNAVIGLVAWALGAVLGGAAVAAAGLLMLSAAAP